MSGFASNLGTTPFGAFGGNAAGSEPPADPYWLPAGDTGIYYPGQVGIGGNGSGAAPIRLSMVPGVPTLFSTGDLWVRPSTSRMILNTDVAGAQGYPRLMMTTWSPNDDKLYSGVIFGFDYSNGFTNKPLIITTCGFGNDKAGDIVIRPGTLNGNFVTQSGNKNIILEPAGTGKTTAKGTFSVLNAIEVKTVIETDAAVTVDRTATVWINQGNNAVYTLPPVAGNTDVVVGLKHAGTGTMDVNGDMFSTAPVTTYPMNIGDYQEFICDGVAWMLK